MKNMENVEYSTLNSDLLYRQLSLFIYHPRLTSVSLMEWWEHKVSRGLWVNGNSGVQQPYFQQTHISQPYQSSRL